jgi:hypothetical protein
MASSTREGREALMGDKLFLEDVRFYGQHGLTRAEPVVSAWFSVADQGWSRPPVRVVRP